jgi:hypothetical protein
VADNEKYGGAIVDDIDNAVAANDKDRQAVANERYMEEGRS